MAGPWPGCEKTVIGPVEPKRAARRGYTGTASAMQTDASAAADRPPGARVLVVEDDEHIRELVMLHLQLEGHTGVGVTDGAEALRLARGRTDSTC